MELEERIQVVLNDLLKSYTQTEIGIALDYSRNAIWKWKNRKSVPNPYKLDEKLRNAPEGSLTRMICSRLLNAFNSNGSKPEQESIP